VYAALKELLGRLLRVPLDPPAPPAGSYASVQVLRASPRWLRYRLVGVAIGSAFAALGLFGAAIAVLVANEPWALAILLLVALVLVVVLGLSAFGVRLDYDLRTYVLTDRSVRVREGAWKIAEMTLTCANIQNVRIEQGPLMRLFGIRDLVIDTAGGGGAELGKHGASSGHTVRLRGLEDASGVRDQLLAHVRRHGRTSGLGDLDDAGTPARGLAATPELVAALRDVRASAAGLRAAAQARLRAE
jgi:membrane protein YdbS with pleckstrin-like domain